MSNELDTNVQSFDCSTIDVNLDSDVKLNIVEKFPSLAKDETARIALIAFDANANNSPLLRMSQAFWVEINENNKFSFAAPSNKELLAKVVRRYGEPKIRFTTIVLRYLTDKNGVLIKNADGTCNFNYYVWQLGTDKWQSLKTMHQEWNLYGRDILMKWDGKSDIKFQNMTLQPAQDCAWKHHPEANAIMEQGRALYEQSMARYIPKEIPEDELVIKLGWADAPVSNNPVNPFEGNATPQAQLTQQAGTTTPENPFNKIVKPS